MSGKWNLASMPEPRVLVWSADEALAGSLGTLWQGLGPGYSRVEKIPRRFAHLSGSTEGVWHLVGQAYDTHGGARFRIEPRKQSEGDLGFQLEAEDLIRYLPNLGLAILQGVPSPRGERTAADRLRAACLRNFAAQVAQTVPAVLIIPPLPPLTALEAVRVLMNGLRPRLWQYDDLGRLVSSVSKLRRRVTPSIEAVRKRHSETAWDVTLWAVDGWRNPLRRGRDSRFQGDST